MGFAIAADRFWSILSLLISIIALLLITIFALSLVRRFDSPHPLIQLLVVIGFALAAVTCATSITTFLSGSVQISNIQLGGMTIKGQGQIVVFVAALIIIFSPLVPFMTWLLLRWRKIHKEVLQQKFVVSNGWPSRTLRDDA